MNRRQFLGTSAGLAAASGLYAAPDDKPLRVGLIGCGWYGKCDLLRLIQVAPVEVVSLCDVDQKQLAGAVEIVSQRQKSHNKPRTHANYLDMLKEKDLEVVLIATPDHWHALPMIAAVEAGADVYVQKPISIDVLEGKAMLDAARKHNRVVQVGTQRRSTPHLIEARDKVVKPGLLGKIGMAEVYCYYHMRGNLNAPVGKPPAFLDYNAWCGPAPVRPYDPQPGPNGAPPLPHRGWWRSFMEYSNGIMGDMCIHMLDMVRWMCGLGWPRRIDSSGGILVQKESKANTADTQTATFNFPEFPVVWNHRTYGASADPEYPWGATIYGDKGTLKLSVHKYEFFPLFQNKPTLSGKAIYEYDKYPEDKDEKDLEQHVASAIREHMRDLLRARAERGRPIADIEQGYISTASCLLANLSMKLGRSLTWHPTSTEVVNDPEANKLLRRPYRDGWTHPG